MPAPDDHFAPGPYCCVQASGLGCVVSVDSCPTVSARIIPSTVVASPHKHFLTRPDCYVTPSRGVGRCDGCPTIGGGIASAAGVTPTAPHDHFYTAPNGCVTGSTSGCVGDTGSS